MNMLKKYWKPLLVTSLVALLPIAVGLLLWDKLPDMMNIHWNASGQADGTAGKAFAILAMPLILLALHLLCFFLTAVTNRRNDQTPKAMTLALWITPVISNMSMALLYTSALGLEPNFGLLTMVPMGLLFMVIGNFMPKFRRNTTMGIKVKWTLADDENWNATHRFGGKLWFWGGLLIVLLSLIPSTWMILVDFIILMVITIVPVVYSWRFHRAQIAAGKEITPYKSPLGKWVWLFVAALTVFLFFIMFTGSITYEMDAETLTVDSNFYAPLTVRFDEIDAIEYREEAIHGSKEMGFSSARLLMGGFRNEEFGGYTRYTYTSADTCIVITSDSRVLVLAEKTEDGTQALYEAICEQIEAVK